MTDEQPVDQTEDVVEEVVETPKKTKKKRKKKAKAAKKETSTDAAQLAVLEKLTEQLGEVGKRLDNLESSSVNAPNLITARGPGAPTTAEREHIELMSQTPGPARQDKTDAERNKERRDAIYARRESIGRMDRQEMPSGVVASVGNRQRRAGATQIVNRPQ